MDILGYSNALTLPLISPSFILLAFSIASSQVNFSCSLSAFRYTGRRSVCLTTQQCFILAWAAEGVNYDATRKILRELDVMSESRNVKASTKRSVSMLPDAARLLSLTHHEIAYILQRDDAFFVERLSLLLVKAFVICHELAICVEREQGG